MYAHIRKTRRGIARTATTLLLVAILGARPLLATTYISAEPIPTQDVIGAAALATLESAGYEVLERWSNLLLGCGVVDDVIGALQTNGSIPTVNGTNTRVVVAAGGFEAVTHPSFVFTVDDSGANAVSEADVDVLDNALGFVLSQGGTAHFTPDNPHAYAFALDYAVVTFDGTLEGVDAKAFFDFLGTIDAALWSGPLAGFTQVTSNSMLFLQPATSKQRFVSGLAMAVSKTTGATYFPLKNNGQATTARAGIAFPGNDWLAFRDGEQYLSHLGNASPQLLATLAALRLQHLEAVDDLVTAIQNGNVERFLRQFRCS